MPCKYCITHGIFSSLFCESKHRVFKFFYWSYQVNKQVKLSVAERAQLIQESIGMTQIDASLLDKVSGGRMGTDTVMSIGEDTTMNIGADTAMSVGADTTRNAG
jgi:hypothetical protein